MGETQLDKLNALLSRLKEQSDREGWIDVATGDRVWRDQDGKEIKRVKVLSHEQAASV
jgi:hypothetical protein